MSDYLNSLFLSNEETDNEMKPKYTISEIADIYKKEGYFIELKEEKFLVVKIQGTNVFVMLADDGDIQFAVIYNVDDNFSLRSLNKINRTYRIGKAYLDDNGRMVIEVLLRSVGPGLTKAQIIQGLKDISLLSLYTEKEFV